MAAYWWMLLGSLSFSVMATLTHALRTACDWQLIALVRAFLALLFASALARVAGVQLVIWKPRTLWLRSLAGSFSLVCTFYAFTHLPISDVMTLTNTFPIWVALLSGLILREPPPLGVWLAIVCAIGGVALIQQPHLAAGNFTTLVALASAVSTAIAMLGLHRLQHVDARAIVVHFSGVSTLFCLAALYLFDVQPTPTRFPASTLLMLLGVGLTATLGQICLTKAFAEGAPAKVSVIGLTQIVFAMLFDAILWGNAFDSLKLLGIALVLAPTSWVMLRR